MARLLAITIFFIACLVIVQREKFQSRQTTYQPLDVLILKYDSGST